MIRLCVQENRDADGFLGMQIPCPPPRDNMGIAYTPTLLIDPVYMLHSNIIKFLVYSVSVKGAWEMESRSV